MSDETPSTGMKSAYELALERLERQGIERPREDSLSDEVRAKMAEARSIAEARLAELEIMYRQRRSKARTALEADELERDYLEDRRRVEAERDRKVETLRETR